MLRESLSSIEEIVLLTDQIIDDTLRKSFAPDLFHERHISV